MRTTIDIDDPVLRDLKRLQKRDGRPLGRLVSDLLARAAAEELKQAERPTDSFEWLSNAMEAKVNLSDRDEVLEAMERQG